MAVELCTMAEIEDRVKTLNFLLLDLPYSGPNGDQFYLFPKAFASDPRIVEDLAAKILLQTTPGR